MPGPSSSIRPFQNTETLANNVASARLVVSHARRSSRFNDLQDGKPLKRFDRVPDLHHRAEAAVLLGFFYSRSELVSGRNTVPLR